MCGLTWFSVIKSLVRPLVNRTIAAYTYFMTTTQHTYKVGDQLTYRPNSGGSRTGVVTGKYDDVKNGEPGFDLLDTDGNDVWGYDDQIVSVSAR